MRFHALLAANVHVGPEELEDRLDAYAKLGFDGVVWRPSGELACEGLAPGDLAALSRGILHAGDLGLSFWVEAAQGWPHAGRRALADARPSSAGEGSVRWLALEGAVREGGRVRGGSARVCERVGTSAFSHEAVAAYVASELERYREGLDPEAFRHLEAFNLGELDFCDGPLRPTPLALPWPAEVEELLRSRGVPLDPASLRSLFVVDSEEARALRERYWEAVCDCAVSSLVAPVRSWCERNGKLCGAWVAGAETPWSELGHAGGASELLGALSLPGASALGREPHGRYHLRLAASAAARSGAGRSFCEAFGGSGNGAAPEDLERHLRLIGSCGVTDVVLRADQLRPTARALRDWPVSLPVHVTWGPVVPSVLERCRHDDARPEARGGSGTLALAPMRALRRRYMPGLLDEGTRLDARSEPELPGTAAARISEAVTSLVDESAALGTCPQLADERELEREGRVERGALVVGAARYQRVVASSEAYESPATSRMLMAAEDAGVEVMTPRGWLASLGRVTTSFAGMPETLEAEGARASGVAVAEAALTGRPLVPAQTPWRITPPSPNLLRLELRPLAELDDEGDEDEGEGPEDDPAANAPAADALAAHGPAGPSPRPGGAAPAGGLAARITFADDLSEAGLVVTLSDPVASLAWDGVPLVLATGARGLPSARLPGGLCAAGVHELVAAAVDEPRPAVFVSGSFDAWARLWPFDGRQMTSPGGFRLYREGTCSELSADLLESGYLFSFLPVTLEKSLEVESTGAYRLALRDVRAPAARIRVDGGEPLDVWGPGFATEPVRLEAGHHELEVELYNSTYNVLGPHHYYRGDASPVTPAQFAGVRNFADPDHAPRHTATDAWHFVRWGVGEDVELVRVEG